MNTVFLLMAEFETPHIPLRDICEKYLSLGFRDACKKAALQELPFPVFRLGSQKSPWLVDINQLAKYLDQAAAHAADTHRKMRSARA